MTEESDIRRRILSVIERRYPNLESGQKAELSSLVFDYIQLLNDSKVEEAATLLLKAYEKLAGVI